MYLKEILLVVPKNRIETFYQDFKKLEQNKREQLKIYEFPSLELKPLELNPHDLFSTFQKVKNNFYDYYVFPSSFAVERFFSLFDRFESSFPDAFLLKNRFAFVGKKSLLSFTEIASSLKTKENVFEKVDAESLIKAFEKNIKVLIFCNKESVFYQKKALLKIKKVRVNFLNLYESKINPNLDLNLLTEFLQTRTRENHKYIFFSSPKLVNSFREICSVDPVILEQEKIKTVSIGQTTYSEVKKVFPKLNNLISPETSYLSMLGSL